MDKYPIEKEGSCAMNQMDKFYSKRENEQTLVSNPNRYIPGLETRKEFVIFIAYNIIPGISEEQNVQHWFGGVLKYMR